MPGGRANKFPREETSIPNTGVVFYSCPLYWGLLSASRKDKEQKHGKTIRPCFSPPIYTCTYIYIYIHKMTSNLHRFVHLGRATLVYMISARDPRQLCFERNHGRRNIEEKSWRRKHGKGTMREISWTRNHGGGIIHKKIVGEESWRRNHRGETIEEEPWNRNHGGGILGKESWMRNHWDRIMGGIMGKDSRGAIWKHMQETPRRHPEAPRAPEGIWEAFTSQIVERHSVSNGMQKVPKNKM